MRAYPQHSYRWTYFHKVTRQTFSEALQCPVSVLFQMRGLAAVNSSFILEFDPPGLRRVNTGIERFVERKGRVNHPLPYFSNHSSPTAHPRVPCLGLMHSPPQTGTGLRLPSLVLLCMAGRIPSSVLPVTPLSLDPHESPRPVSVACLVFWVYYYVFPRSLLSLSLCHFWLEGCA